MRGVTIVVGGIVVLQIASANLLAGFEPSPFIVWTDVGTGKVQRMDLSGPDQGIVQDLVTSGIAEPRGVTVDPNLGVAGKMYITDSADGKIFRANLDGNGLATLVSGLVNPWDIVAGYEPSPFIVWTDPGSAKVQSTDDEGTTLNDLITSGITEPRGLDVDVDHDGMYVTDSSDGTIFWANSDGGGLTELVSGLVNPWDIVAGYEPSPFIVWTDPGSGKVQRADLAFASPPTVLGVTDLIASGIGSPTGIALDVDHGWMFITDDTYGRIWRAKLDGSDVTPIVTGLSSPQGIAYVGVYVTLTLTEVNGSMGDVDVDPNLPQYPIGASVTLTAVPIEGKSLRHWEIYDPNFPGDANYVTIDSNNPANIVMMADREVTAVFRCGSSTAPLLPIMLGVLGLFVWVRRRQ